MHCALAGFGDDEAREDKLHAIAHVLYSLYCDRISSEISQATPMQISSLNWTVP